MGCGRKKGEVELNQRKWRGRVRIAFVRRREGMERFVSEICRASISRAIIVTVWRRTTGTSCHNHSIFHCAVNCVEESKNKHARLQTRKQETALVIQIRTQRQCMTKCKGSNGAIWKWVFLQIADGFASGLPQGVRCSQLSAMPVQHAGAPEQAQSDIPPTKHTCDKQVSSWRHINCHIDKNRYYT